MTAVYFIDSRVTDYRLIAAAVPGSAVVMLGDESNGLDQIAAWLAANQVSGLDAIHIVSEGSPGALILGDGLVSTETLAGQAAVLAAIGAALSETGDLLLYGCGVGQGTEGEAFLAALAAATGADVAASVDATGAADWGGNWVLETATGPIEAEALAAPDYAGLLALPVLDASKSPTAGFQTVNAATPTGAVGFLVSDLVDFSSVGGVAQPGGLDNVSDADAGAKLGIAITAVASTSTYGTWYYSLNGGATWSTVGTVSTSSALPLAADANTRLYFKPATGYAGDLASALTFKAWDQTTGTAGTKASTTSGGISGSVSAASDTVSITVGHAFADTSAADTFADATGTLQGTGADTISGGSSGSWTIAGTTYTDMKVGAYGALYVKDGTTTSMMMMGSSTAGTYRYVPNAAAIEALGTGAVASDVFTVTSGSTDVLTFRATGANDAPVLDASKSPALQGQAANAGAPTGAVGTLVSSLVDFSSAGGTAQPGGLDNVSDADGGAQLGIALTAVNSAHGAWFYTTNGGAAWTAVGAVSAGNALLLAADADTRLYFQPDAGYAGTLADALTFKAWDRTSGTAGTKVDTASGSAFSSASDTASLTIANPSNHAPEFTGAPVALSYADTAAYDGFSTATGTLAASDADSDVLVYGIAGGVTGGSALIGGVTYDVSLANAYGTLYVKSATGQYTFVPNHAAINALPGGATASAGFTVTVSDGQVTASQALTLDLGGANDAPVLDASKSPAFAGAYNGGAPSGAVGALVSSLVDFASPAGQVDNVTDADTGALLGIAITATGNQGIWYYSTNGGSTWNAVGAVSEANALLLAADATTRVYFQPNAGFIGTAAFTFKAWDQTSGTVGSKADSTAGSAFSSASDTVAVSVAPSGIHTVYNDTSAAPPAETFPDWTGTISGGGADSIAGGETGSWTIGGTTYTDRKVGSYGVLYVQDGSSSSMMMMGSATSGTYRYVPNAAAIDALGEGQTGQDTFSVSWSYSSMMGSSSGTDVLTVYVVGAAEANAAPVLAAPAPIALVDTAAWDTLASSIPATAVNPSFASGDTTGWTVAQGAATLVNYHDGGPDAYYPVDGDGWFLKLEPGAAGVYTTASQTLTLAAGQTVSGFAAFDSGDAYPPGNDSAYVRIYDGAGHLVATPWYADVASLGAFTDLPWTAWQWTPAAAGDYRIEYGAANGGDDEYPSYGLFDALEVAAISGGPSGGLAVVTGTLSATDTPGDVLTYGIQGVVAVGGVATLAGTYGTLAVNTASGAYTFTPNAEAVNALPAGSNPVENFTVTVSDGGLSDSQTLAVQLTGANDAPLLIVPAPAHIADTEAPDSFAPLAGNLHATDAEGDPVGFGLQGITPVGGIATQTGAYGTLALDIATGAYTFTPDAAAIDALAEGAEATASFTVTASDGSLVSSAALQFHLMGANDAPTGSATAVLPLGSEGVNYLIQAGDLVQGYSDAEGDALSADQGSVDHGSLWDNGDGTWTFVPEAGYHGAVNLDYLVVDGHGGQASASRSFTLAQAPSLGLPAAPVTLRAGTPLSLALAASLGGGGPVNSPPAPGAAGDSQLTYAATRSGGGALPAWLSLDPATGLLSGTPGADDLGSLGLRVTATNAAGASVSGEVLLSVTCWETGQVQAGGDGDHDFVGSANGVDTVSYAGAGAGVNVSLAVGGPQQTGAGTDTLVGIDNLIGSAYDDVLTGNAGDNVLDGGAGADTMAGGAGNDTYIVDDPGDQVAENGGAGTDTVMSSIDYTLPANVEKLVLLGSGNLSGTGNGLNNTLIGNGGNNILNGGAGADSMAGGAGDDIYVVDNLLDLVVEKPGEGIDTVLASIGYTLPANVENLTLTGSGNLNGTGNALDNVIVGNSGNNILTGGLGNDTLTGGAGADRFQFTTAPNAAANLDLVTDFQPGTDKIALSKAVFTAFSGVAVNSALGNAEIGNHLLYNASTGLLSYDADGSAGAGAAVPVVILGNHPAALSGTDFIVIT